MKNKILFPLMLLMLTGCSATYDLYIGDKFTDDIYIYEDNDIVKKLDYYDMNDNSSVDVNYYNYNIALFEKKFDYGREEYSDFENSGYIYNYTYDHDDMNKKSMIYDCYDSINITRDDVIVIETSNEFKCFEKYSLLDDVTVNIHYSGQLINTNADSYNDNVYTWNINKDNYNNKNIYLKIKRNESSNTFEIIGGIIFGILILVSVVFVWRYRKKNS